MGTIEQLRGQWINPSDVSTILMVIGGDVVQNAFAQGTGQLYTPVCFSFGCVAYAFITLVNIVGDGRLLPRPDYPVKVFNLESGYARENKNWVVGRLLRDIEAQVARRQPLEDGTGIRISVFEALENENEPTRFSWSFLHVIGALVTALQVGVAAIPIALDRQWGVMFITWRAEKLPNGQKSKDCYALTSGNGSTDIVVVIGKGLCLNLEEMSASQSPRVNRPWEKFQWLSRPIYLDNSEKGQASKQRKSKTFRGFPLGFFMTQITCWVLSVLWLLLLVNVAATKDYTWCILGVGALGMFQNAWLAAAELPSSKRNMPLWYCDTIMTHKVMDGIMDFDITYGRGIPLMEEFFPGRLHSDEVEWWRGNRKRYDEKRMKDSIKRGIPRSKEPVLPTSTLDPSLYRRMSWAKDNHPNSLHHIKYEPSTRFDDLRTRHRSGKSDASVRDQELGIQHEVSEETIQHMPERGTGDDIQIEQQQQQKRYERAVGGNESDPPKDMTPMRPQGVRLTSRNVRFDDDDYEQRVRDATRSPAWA
ncbi:uncharacterized protein PG998_006494 [Apiospora kogelbergensis]|uniref:uncharacterized protein n=1 Tax=Apiospora kogelbergensis TaxID=1337665 RepID=UPI0031308150